MKKILLILIISVAFLSCEKEKENCYHCEFGPFNGQNPPPQEYCGEPGRIFYDDQGNSLGSGSCDRTN